MRVRSLVLFHYMLSRRVVDAKQLSRLLDGSTLNLDDVDEMKAFLGFYLHITTFRPYGPDTALVSG